MSNSHTHNLHLAIQKDAQAVPKTHAGASRKRVSSKDLFGSARELEVEHEGRIYHLRVTQLNKLILTA